MKVKTSEQEESRKQFEAWITQWWPQVKGNICRDGDSYSNHFMNYAWEGWQASRRAIAVNLGKPIYVKHNGDYIHAWPAYNVDIAIRAAGLTVKGDR